MRKEIEDACETIDAMVYSGDMLEFERERDDFKEYVDRWMLKILEFEENARDEEPEEEEEEEEKEEEKDWFFTFGFGHAHPNGYVKISGTFHSAREEMHRRYGPKWAFQYNEEEFPAIAVRWGMKEVTDGPA